MSHELDQTLSRNFVCFAGAPHHHAADDRLHVRFMVANQTGETRRNVRVHIFAILGAAIHKKLPIVLRLTSDFERARVDLEPGASQLFDFIKRSGNTPTQRSVIGICAPAPQKLGILNDGQYRLVVRVMSDGHDAVEYIVAITGTSLQTVVTIESAGIVAEEMAELLPGMRRGILDLAGVRALPKKDTVFIAE